MVVDHVEHDREAELVRSVDKGTKVVRGAVQTRGRVRKHTVVPPPELARELRHRHRLDDGDAETRELGQLLDCRAPRPFPGEGSAVHFVDDLANGASPQPALVGPPKRSRIDDGGRTERPLRLKPRRGIGQELAPETKAILIARRRVGHERRGITARFGVEPHLDCRSSCGLDDHRDFRMIRRPDSKMRTAAGLQLSPDRKASGIPSHPPPSIKKGQCSIGAGERPEALPLVVLGSGFSLLGSCSPSGFSAAF